MIIYVILGGVFMIFNIIQKFENLINNLIDIVAHPIKNISYISAFVLYFILCPINIYKLSGKEMFLFSCTKTKQYNKYITIATKDVRIWS